MALAAMAVNWKTTASGAAAILAVVADLATSYGTGRPPNIEADLAGFMTGIGLLFAKDGNVTGGTTSAVTGESIAQPVSIIGRQPTSLGHQGL